MKTTWKGEQVPHPAKLGEFEVSAGKKINLDELLSTFQAMCESHPEQETTTADHSPAKQEACLG